MKKYTVLAIILIIFILLFIASMGIYFIKRNEIKANIFSDNLISYLFQRGRFVRRSQNGPFFCTCAQKASARKTASKGGEPPMAPSVSPLNWTGNKSCIYDMISGFMPEHTRYIEPCMGSAEVFMRKKPTESEIINDFNGDLTTFFRVVKSETRVQQLIGRLFVSGNTEELFKEVRRRNARYRGNDDTNDYSDKQFFVLFKKQAE